MIYRKLGGPLEEQMRDMNVCDKACLDVVWTSSLFSHDKSQCSLADELLGRGF